MTSAEEDSEFMMVYEVYERASLQTDADITYSRAAKIHTREPNEQTQLTHPRSYPDEGGRKRDRTTAGKKIHKKRAKKVPPPSL